MRGRVPVVLSLLAVLLAGCSGAAVESDSGSASSSLSSPSSSGPAANATKAPNVVQRFTLDDCTNYGGLFTVPMATAQAALPEGFTPVAAPNDPQGGARLYLIGLTCASSSVDGNATGPAAVGYAELAATPSAAYTVDGLSDCTVPVFFVSSNAAIGAAGEALQLGLSGVGGAAVNETPLSGVLSMGGVEVDREGAHLEFTVQLADQDTGSVASGSFALYGVQEGEVRSILKGTSSDGTARQGVAYQRVVGIPVAEDAELTPVQGFSASGFSLTFERKPLP